MLQVVARKDAASWGQNAALGDGTGRMCRTEFRCLARECLREVHHAELP
jgi:hypothetical protein